MIYKSNIGDSPLKDFPCEYWWVRYAVSCTYLQEQFENIWNVRLEQLKEKHGILTFSSRGLFDVRKIRTKKLAKAFLEAKIWITLKDKTEREVTPQEDKEIWNVLRTYLQESARVSWSHCPFEEDKQSNCPFYKPNEFYKDTPLAELRTRKGYNL